MENQNKIILLKVLGMENPTQNSTYKRRYGLFKCFCGKEFKSVISSIKNKYIKSCGCLHTTHNLTNHRLYSIWNSMMQRCYNLKEKSYKDYGKRGIVVCNDWHNVENFINDMYPSFIEGLTLDRENPNGNYEKSNCRWANKTVQARNTQRLRKDNSSGYRGVSWHKRDLVWNVRISVDNKRIHLGYFNTALDGALAYDNYITVNNLEHTKNFT